MRFESSSPRKSSSEDTTHLFLLNSAALLEADRVAVAKLQSWEVMRFQIES